MRRVLTCSAHTGLDAGARPEVCAVEECDDTASRKMEHHAYVALDDACMDLVWRRLVL